MTMLAPMRGRPAATTAPHFPPVPLAAAIASREAEILERETAYAEACEAEALRAIPAADRPRREHWNADTWRRYLDAAARLAPDHTPRISRLYAELDQLRRLSTLRERAA
jgi:hypothetical protein